MNTSLPPVSAVRRPSTTPAPGSDLEATPTRRREGLFIYLVVGIVFGIVFLKSEVASWYRIQEMFRFQSFHVYGFMGSGLVVAAVGLHLIKRFRVNAINGEPIVISPKEWGRGYRYWIGGTIFGLGWSLTSACPNALFALTGSGLSVMLVALLSALAGTWAYGYLRPRLPH